MNEILIRKAKKGDKDAFCRLIDENVQSMYKVAAAYLKNDEDVADAIQDTILSCYENLKSLKQNRYFKTWMIRILINKCKDMIQKKKLVTYTDQMPETDLFLCIIKVHLDIVWQVICLLQWTDNSDFCCETVKEYFDNRIL